MIKIVFSLAAVAALVSCSEAYPWTGIIRPPDLGAPVKAEYVGPYLSLSDCRVGSAADHETRMDGGRQLHVRSQL